MPPIDDKVVAMSFESSKFEQGVNNTISALDKLKAALHFPNAGKGMDDISSAAKRVDLSHISTGVEAIKGALNALRLVAIGVMSQLATQAVRAGARFVSAFTLDPAKAGFAEYSTNLNAVQTILANTQASGAKLADVNAALLDLNKYSDKTIYNFSQMAKNIGTFTAAGVDLDTSTQAIKGIANLAALSGSNADQASTAMYQLSQAISAGRVGLQDWNSVVNAGMGGTVFQRALATTAANMGTLEESSLKLVGPMKNVSIAGESFRQSLQAGPGKTSWLTSKVLTNTLKQFTGDLTDAQLKAEGFNASQIKAIQQTAKTAMHAATEVKTLSQVLDVAKETAGSGWAQTWQIIFGNFGEAKATFTALSGTINGFINANADARNKVLADWKALGGRTVLINSIKTAFENLGKVVAPIKNAFRDIFPAITGKNLFDLTLKLQAFTKMLEPSPTTVENLRRTFRGLFAVMDIGKQVIQGIFAMFGKLFGALSGGSGGFLNLTANVGDFLVKVDLALKKSGGIVSFFESLGEVLAKPVELFGKLAEAIGHLFDGFSSGGFSDQMSGLTSAMTPFQRVMEAVSTAWHNFMDGIQESGVLQSALDGIIKFIQGVGPAISNAASSMNFEAILAVIRTGLFAGLVLMLKNFFGKGSFLDQIGKGFGGGILKNISGSFDALRGSMEALQTNIKAGTLQKIAFAIAALTASVVALSFVDQDKLKKSLTAITVMFGQLLGAMAVLDKIAASRGFIKLPIIAGAMILLGGAIDVLAVAVFALGKLNWGELLRGLSGVGALLAGISAASIPLSANSAGMIRAGIGIGAIAVGMNLLALAVRQMSGLSWQEMAKGLAGVAGGLVALTAAVRKMPASGMIAMGVGVIALAGGLKIMASAMEDFAGMSWKDIGKGLVGVGGALVIIAGAMKLMPSNMLLTAAGLLAISFALGKITAAVISMSGLSLREIATGLGTLAGALVILAGALYAMSGTLAGAAALTVAAAGISLLAGALAKMGAMSWEDIIKSMATLAGALTILGIAGIALAPVVPVLLGLGAALVLLGAGLALAGAGVFLIGAGLSAIAIAGPTAVGILVAALLELEKGVVELAKNFILGILEIVDALAATAPKFVDAMIKIINSLLDVVIRSMPKVADAFTAIIDAVLKVLRDNQSKIVQAGFDLLVALLRGIKNNMPALVTLVSDIIVKFVQSLTSNLNRIIDAGDELLAAFIKGIVRHVANIVSSVVEIIAKFVQAVAGNLGDILSAGVTVLAEFLDGIAKNIDDAIRAGAEVIVKLIKGIGDAADDVVRAAVDTMILFMDTLVEESVKLIDAGAIAIVNFLNGVATAIDAHAGEIRQAGVRVGVALIDGLTGGLTAKAGELYGKISGIMDHAMSLVHKIPLIGSPSKVTTDVGEFIILGLVKGMKNTETDLYRTVEAISNELIQSFKDVFKIQSPSKVMHDIGQLVGQGFAEGLKGSQDDIRSAFEDLNNKLTDAMVTARETITSEQEKLSKLRQDTVEQQAKLDKLRAEKKPDADAIKRAVDDLKETGIRIKEVQAVIKENEDVLAKTTAGHKELVKTLADEKHEMIILAGDYKRLSDKLEEAHKVLDDARKARRDAIASTTAQFSALPALDTTATADIVSARKDVADAKNELNELLAANEQDAEAITRAQTSVASEQAKLAELLKGKTLDSTGNSVDQLATYEDALKHQTAAIGAYNSTLVQLRKLGLDDATFKKLVDEGVADAAFAKQLLSGGSKAVTSLNKLDTKLQKVSQALGTNVGKELFTAGVQAAQGIVDGLDDRKDEVSKKMKQIGEEMVATLRKSLGMKSPSREMMDVGRLSMEGLALGFTNNTKVVTDAADKVAQDALTAMQNSMLSVRDAVVGELDMSPVITPVLDLTQIQGQARVLSNLIPITAAASYGQASIISSQQRETQTEVADTTLVGAGVKFEQNNYSPVALTEIEIYRQTRNQLSQLKSVLGPN